MIFAASRDFQFYEIDIQFYEINFTYSFLIQRFFSKIELM